MGYADNYYSENCKNGGLGKKEVSYMSNFCAYQFWQHALKVIISHLCAVSDHMFAN